MFFRMILFVWEFVLDLSAVMRMTKDEKDLEILLLRQQLRIVERKQPRGSQIPRWQKVLLAVLVVRLKDQASHGRATLVESVLCWLHHTSVRKQAKTAVAKATALHANWQECTSCSRLARFAAGLGFERT